MHKNIRAINLGCGLNPIKDFTNYDYNFFITLSKIPWSKFILSRMNFVPNSYIKIIEMAKKKQISFCNAAVSIPEKKNSIDLIYSSHVLEHLDSNETDKFLSNCKEILRNEGILRLVVPDFDILVNNYLSDKDVNTFIKRSCLVGDKPKNILKKLQYLIQGHGWHHQMFTKKSLEKVLKKNGFRSIEFFEPGSSKIPFNNSINLYDHAGVSLYCESIK
jgi:predicted SAM-dependent methyltransferase